MIGYATRTGTKRNLDALRAAGWRIFMTPDPHPVPPGFKYACDSGAWGCFRREEPFNEKAYRRLIDKWGAGADFVVAPDIVADGKNSLPFSESWMPYLRNLRLVLLVIQDGMTADDVGSFLRRYPNTGLFMGGSTEYKLSTMFAWGMVAHAFQRHYHIGRVNTARRVQLAAEAGADSFDGTSVTRYSSTLPLLDSSLRQPRLFTARTGAGSTA